MARELTSAEKRRFMSLKYFGTTDNPQDDVNPYESVNDFLANSVGSLNWGISPTARRNSKDRFAYNFHKVLDIYKVVLSQPAILKIINDDNMNNDNAVNEFINCATFPLS